MYVSNTSNCFVLFIMFDVHILNSSHELIYFRYQTKIQYIQHLHDLLGEDTIKQTILYYLENYFVFFFFGEIYLLADYGR